MSRARWNAVVVSLLVSAAATACATPTAVATAQVVRPPQFAASEVVPARRAVVVMTTSDASNRLARAGRERVTDLVRLRMERTGFQVDTAPAFVVSPGVTAVEITRGAHPTVACKVSVRVAPAKGGTEQWVANETAIATGAATVSGGGGRPQQIARSLEDCVATATEETVIRQVLPFLEGALAEK